MDSDRGPFLFCYDCELAARVGLGELVCLLDVGGQLDEVVIDTLMDLCDKNGDGKIKADEFASEVLAGSNSYFFADMSDTFQSTFDVQGM